MMKPYSTFGEPMNASRVVAEDVAYDNLRAAYATLGRAVMYDADERTIEYLKRVARARKRKAERAEKLEFGEAMRIQSVI